MDRFQAAEWMVEHPGQRMVDSEGDEWRWNIVGGFTCNSVTQSPFAFGPTIRFEPKRESIKPCRKRVVPVTDCVGPYVRLPKRFEGRTIELRAKVCDD